VEDDMQIRKILCSVFLSIFTITLLVLNIGPAYAADELFLRGVVKSVDIVKKTVTIDVKSSSCRGTRIFTIEKPLEVEDLVGERIDFSIDSSTCKSDEVYSMLSYWRVKR
jgi:hypothetical protein